MDYFVTLTMQVKAAGLEEAFEMGVNAALHLNETFNDDESIRPVCWVESGQPPSQLATVINLA